MESKKNLEQVTNKRQGQILSTLEGINNLTLGKEEKT